MKNSTPTKELPKCFLEQSISLVERSSLKLYPVVREVVKRLAGQETLPPPGEDRKDSPSSHDNDEEEDSEPDMRSVLGFLNQNEWV